MGSMMVPTTPQGLVTRIHDEFDCEGWRGSGDLAVIIVRHLEELGRLDARAGASCAPISFRTRNRIRRSQIEAALDRAFAGRQLKTTPDQGVHVQGDINVSITGDNNTVGNLNLAGQQFNLTAQTPKAEALDAVQRLVAEALVRGNWPKPELEELDAHLGQRDDVVEDEVVEAAQRAIDEAHPEPSQLKQLRNSL